MTDKTDGPRSTPRWFKVVLVLSLGLNLVIIGMFAGAALDHRGGPGDRGVLGPAGMLIYARALEPEQRRELADGIRAHRAEMTAGRQALRAHIRDMAAALRADPYDPTAVDALLARQVDRAGQLIGIGNQSLSQVLAGMSDAERAALADRLEETANRRKHR